LRVHRYEFTPRSGGDDVVLRLGGWPVAFGPFTGDPGSEFVEIATA
jgi:hypothetical protein